MVGLGERATGGIVTTSGVTKLAVFDLDGTLMDEQSGVLLASYLFKHGELSLGCLANLFFWALSYKMRLPHRKNRSHELVLGSILDLTPEQVDQLMRSFHNEVMVPLYRDEARAEVERLKHEGLTTLLVSATFRPIAEACAETFGFDGVVATEMEKDERGAYTGRVDADVISGREKLVAATTWANDRFGRDGWRIAYAYGDHHTDRALLSAADQPYAVSPDHALKRTAHKLGWPVLEWSHR